MSVGTLALEDVKAAFWKVFHETGECWFNYLGTPAENLRDTEAAWQEFEAALSEAAKERG